MSTRQDGIRLELCAGGAIGALTGILVGLSASPVVATILATVTTLVLAVVSRPKREPESDKDAERAADRAFSARVVGFGVGCAVLVCVGVYMRAHNTLGVSLDQRLKEIELLTKASVPMERALELTFGTKAGEVGPGEKKTVTPRPGEGVLYADDDAGGLSRLDAMAPAKYSNDADLLEAWANGGWPYSLVERAARRLPVAQRREAIEESHRIIADRINSLQRKHP